MLDASLTGIRQLGGVPFREGAMRSVALAAATALAMLAAGSCKLTELNLPTIRIHGTVTSVQDSTPIQGASVYANVCLEWSLSGCTERREIARDVTDSDGTYSLSGQPARCDWLRVFVEHPDYDPDHFSSYGPNPGVRCTEDVQVLNFYLQPRTVVPTPAP